MALITAAGVGSNLDLEGLIEQILDAERRPAETRMEQSQTRIESSISALGMVKSGLSSFQSTLTRLSDPDFFSRRTATSGDSTLFTATASGAAEPGNYRIEVLNLAETNRIASSGFSSANSQVGSGRLGISVGDATFNVDVNAGTTLAQLRDAINNAPGNTGVRASLITVDDGNGGTETRLALTSQRSGAAGQLGIEVSDAQGALAGFAFDVDDANSPMTQLEAGRDARITIDGFVVSSSSNEFRDAIQGVTLNLLRAGGPDAETPPSALVNIASDRSGIRSAIEEFVGNYNALVGVFREVADFNPEDGTRGLLGGDASLNLVRSQLQRALSGAVEGAPDDFSALSFLGITTNRDGTLNLNQQRLDSALEQRPGDVAALFAGENGVASRLNELSTRFLSREGVFANREQSLQQQLGRIDQERERLALRLESIESRYRTQFAALDALVFQLNQTSDFLFQQLEASAQIVNNSRRR